MSIFYPVHHPIPYMTLRRQRGGVVYLLYDEFTTAEAAPLASPRTCEPGPGNLDITETILSIASGRLVANGTTSADSYVADSTGRTPAAGLAHIIKSPTRTTVNTGNRVGWPESTPGDIGVGVGGSWLLNTWFRVYISNSIIVEYSGLTTGEHTVASILRGASGSGGFLCLKDNGIYRLVWVYDGTTSIPASPKARIRFAAAAVNQTFDDFAVRQLPAPWASAYGIATGYTASPASGATLPHEADCLAEITWTASAGVTTELDIRRTDADNRWIVRCSQSGSTIKLIERNAGVETERSSAAQTWNPGTAYRVVVVADGAAIGTYVNFTAKNSYTSATFNQTATGAQITASAGALANFATWPRTLSGAALAALEAV